MRPKMIDTEGIMRGDTFARPSKPGQSSGAGGALSTGDAQDARDPARRWSRSSNTAEEKSVLGLTSGYYEMWRRTLLVIGTGAGCFVVVVAVALLVPAISNPQAKEDLYQRVDPLVYMSTMIAQATTFLLTATSLLAERDSSKVQLTLMMMYITAISGVVDFLGWQGLGPVVYDGLGRPLFVMHYMTWAHTTPVMIYLVSLVSSSKVSNIWEVYQHMGMDVAMNLLGLAGALSPRPLAFVWIAASCFCYIRVIIFMMHCFSEAAGLATNATDRRSMRIVQYFTLAMWSAFPLLWFVAESGAISKGLEETLWVYVSLLSKVVFSTSLITSNFVTLQQRHAKEEAQKENQRRNDLVKSLQGTLQSRDHLMSLMSHELKTPLNGIIGLSQGMLMGAEGEPFDDEEVRTFIGTVQTRSEHLMQLIVDFLDSASLKKGNLSIAYKTVNVSEIITETVMLATPLLAPNVDIRTNIKGRLPPVQADPTRLTQIISNLLGNAAKFTEKGSITLTASIVGMIDDDVARRAEAAASDIDLESLRVSYVRIEVMDTGPGIPPDELDKIFMPLYQVDMSSGRKHEGAGLGLSLIKELIEAHGGTVSVESELGYGSVFEVMLPVKPPRSADTTTAAPGTPGTPKPSYGGQVTRPGDSTNSARSNLVSDPSSALAPVRTTGGLERASSGMRGAGGMRSGAGTPQSSNSAKKAVDGSPVPRGAGRRRGSFVFRPTLTRQNTVKQELTNLSKAWIRATKQKPTFSEKTGKTRILSVDDDNVNQMVMKKILKSTGYEVDIAMDGTQALNMIKESEFLHDLILLDVMMPGLTGYEVCQAIRASEDDLSTLPVVMVSAKSKPEDIVTGFNAGSNDYISKPINSKDLVTRIEAQLRVVESWRGKMRGSIMADKARKLPETVVARIGKGEIEIADEYKELTCLRAEMVNFKGVVALVDRQGLMDVLCDVKESFGEICDSLGIYHVPGSGALTAVTGHERAGAATQADRQLDLAIQFLDALDDISEHRGCPLEFRIGMHTGGAYAGVVDGKMPQYSFWGEAVEGATRLEETCPVNCIHLSQTMHSLAHKQKSPLVDKVCEYSVVKMASGSRVPTFLMKAGEWSKAIENAPASVGNDTSVSPDEVKRLTREATEAKDALAKAQRVHATVVEKERQATTERDRIQAREESVREERDRLRATVAEKDAALLAAAAKAAESLTDAERRLEEARAAATRAARDEAAVLSHARDEGVSRENQDLRDRLTSAEASLEAARDELREALKEREAAAKEAAQAHGDLRAEMATLAAREGSSKERLEELQAKVKELETSRTELTLEVGTLKGALSASEKVLKGYQDRFDREVNTAYNLGSATKVLSHGDSPPQGTTPRARFGDEGDTSLRQVSNGSGAAAAAAEDEGGGQARRPAMSLPVSEHLKADSATGGGEGGGGFAPHEPHGRHHLPHAHPSATFPPAQSPAPRQAAPPRPHNGDYQSSPPYGHAPGVSGGGGYIYPYEPAPVSGNGGYHRSPSGGYGYEEDQWGGAHQQAPPGPPGPPRGSPYNHGGRGGGGGYGPPPGPPPPGPPPGAYRSPPPPGYDRRW